MNKSNPIFTSDSDYHKQIEEILLALGKRQISVNVSRVLYARSVANGTMRRSDETLAKVNANYEKFVQEELTKVFNLHIEIQRKQHSLNIKRGLLARKDRLAKEKKDANSDHNSK